MTVVMKSDEELMAEYQAEKKVAKENKTFDNFFFFLAGDGSRATFAPLINFPQLTRAKLLYHEKYDHVTSKWVADNVCAAQFEKECKFCREATAQNDKKLKPYLSYFLPIYVHSITKVGPDGKQQIVTYQDDSGIERPVKGVRMYRLKRSVMDQLEAAYEAAGDLTAMNFMIKRNGTGLDTTYTVTSLPKVLPIDEQIPTYSVDRVISDVRLHREEQAIESDTESSDTDVPQITVEEALDIQKPSPNQLRSIQNLCNLLGKQFVEPISFGQAANMVRNLNEEWQRSLAE